MLKPGKIVLGDLHSTQTGIGQHGILGINIHTASANDPASHFHSQGTGVTVRNPKTFLFLVF